MQLKLLFQRLPLLTRWLVVLVLPAGAIAWMGSAFDLGEWLLIVVGTLAVLWLCHQDKDTPA